MTDEVNSEVLNTELEPAAQQQETKTFNQERLDKMFNAAKAKGENAGYKKGYEQAMSELRSQYQSNTSQQEMPKTESELINALDKVLDQRQKKIDEQSKQVQYQQAMQKAQSELAQKIDDAQKKFPDYRQVLEQANNFADAPAILMMANSVDNGGEVLYELAKNPSKATQILTALTANAPSIATNLIKNLSQSIKNNNEADSHKVPDEPLRQINPSNYGVGKAPSTASDFAKAFKGRY